MKIRSTSPSALGPLGRRGYWGDPSASLAFALVCWLKLAFFMLYLRTLWASLLGISVAGLTLGAHSPFSVSVLEGLGSLDREPLLQNLLQILQQMEDPQIWSFRDSQGNSLLDRAILGQHFPLLAYLVQQRSFPLNNKNSVGETPLHTVLRYTQGDFCSQVVVFLVGKGIDLHQKGLDGFSVLHYAAANSTPGLVPYLLEKGADVTQRDQMGLTILHHEVILTSSWEECLSDSLITLAATSFSLDCQDPQGQNPLHYAVQRRLSNVQIQLLSALQIGWMGQKDKRGMAPYRLLRRLKKVDKENAYRLSKSKSYECLDYAPPL